MDFYVRARAAFSAGHTIPGTEHAHQHGHAYTVSALIKSTPDPATGFPVDPSAYQTALAGLARELHLRNLNEMLPAAPPTKGFVAAQIMDRLSAYYRVIEVEVSDESGESEIVRRELR
jgi:6-pyruvoyl-tetrahydropterin synthase